MLRRVFRFSIAAWGILIVTACVQEPEDPSTLSATRTFWSTNIVTSGSEQLDADKIGETAHCAVYAERAALNSRYVTVSQGQNIANTYETIIHPTITTNFGEPADVDNNGKIILLLLDIKDGYSEATKNDGYVGGYFDPAHMRKQSKSNGADMLFIDVSPQDAGSTGFYATIAHELQHLINYSQTVVKGKNQKDLWINEGLSTAAEYLYGVAAPSPSDDSAWGDPCGRVEWAVAVNWDIINGFGTPDKLDNFFVWDNKLSDYATAYLFFQWLRIHANSSGIYKDIVDDSQKDFNAVANAAQKYIQADSSLGITEWTWENLLGIWHASNFYSNTTTGLLGYKNFSVITDTLARFQRYSTEQSLSLAFDRISKAWNFSSPQTISMKNGEGLVAAVATAPADQTSLDIKSCWFTTAGAYTTEQTSAKYQLVYNAKSSSSSKTPTLGAVPQGPQNMLSVAPNIITQRMSVGRSVFDIITQKPRVKDVHFNDDGHWHQTPNE
jgi:hypothetical protein